MGHMRYYQGLPDTYRSGLGGRSVAFAQVEVCHHTLVVLKNANFSLLSDVQRGKKEKKCIITSLGFCLYLCKCFCHIVLTLLILPPGTFFHVVFLFVHEW